MKSKMLSTLTCKIGIHKMNPNSVIRTNRDGRLLMVSETFDTLGEMIRQVSSIEGECLHCGEKIVNCETIDIPIGI